MNFRIGTPALKFDDRETATDEHCATTREMPESWAIRNGRRLAEPLSGPNMAGR